jgi:ribosome-associated protein
MSGVPRIPEDEIELSSIASSGPGGQNVNKVATAVQLRFDIRHSPSLPEGVRQRLLSLGGNRVTREGVLVITARAHRTREANRRDALARLEALVERASHVPKKRVKTKPTAAARRKRLDDKRHGGRAKSLRRRPSVDD